MTTLISLFFSFLAVYVTYKILKRVMARTDQQTENDKREQLAAFDRLHQTQIDINLLKLQQLQLEQRLLLSHHPIHNEATAMGTELNQRLILDSLEREQRCKAALKKLLIDKGCSQNQIDEFFYRIDNPETDKESTNG